MCCLGIVEERLTTQQQQEHPQNTPAKPADSVETCAQVLKPQRTRQSLKRQSRAKAIGPMQQRRLFDPLRLQKDLFSQSVTGKVTGARCGSRCDVERGWIRCFMMFHSRMAGLQHTNMGSFMLFHVLSYLLKESRDPFCARRALQKEEPTEAV